MLAPKANIDDLVKTLAPDMEQVNNIIMERLKSQSPLSEKIATHLINSGGKRLRPIVVLSAAYLSGVKNMLLAQKMAAAIEIMHTATLLHDDVIDESAKRRNMPTAHILWGNSAAILVGDFLLGRAFELMVDVGSLSVLKILSGAAAIIAEGEVMQLDLKGDIDIKETEMMTIIAAKTASLFAAAAETGAILAGINDTGRVALRDYGYNLGMAFQLMDDALDYDGASSRFGKPAGTDFFEGKITLPAILCWHKGLAAERNFWQKSMKNPASSKPSDLKKACALMKKYGALIATREYALDYVLKAKQALKAFNNDSDSDNAWLVNFETIANFCVEREF